MCLHSSFVKAQFFPNDANLAEILRKSTKEIFPSVYNKNNCDRFRQSYQHYAQIYAQAQCIDFTYFERFRRKNRHFANGLLLPAKVEIGLHNSILW